MQNWERYGQSHFRQKWPFCSLDYSAPRCPLMLPFVLLDSHFQGLSNGSKYMAFWPHALAPSSCPSPTLPPHSSCSALSFSVIFLDPCSIHRRPCIYSFTRPNMAYPQWNSSRCIFALFRFSPPYLCTHNSYCLRSFCILCLYTSTIEL